MTNSAILKVFEVCLCFLLYSMEVDDAQLGAAKQIQITENPRCAF
jgi:hypothetical protein